MSDKGIGASVRRKEDQRFVRGRGNYVADMVRPGMAWGAFVRSPHAHATITRHRHVRRRRHAGRARCVLTGADLAAAGVGGLPCGWGIKGPDGTPMKEPPHPALAQGKVRYVGDAVAFVVAETAAQARDAAEAITVTYELLPAVIDLEGAIAPGASLLFDDVPNNLCSDWEIGDARDGRCRLRQGRACRAHQAREQPPGRQPDGAARGDRRA